MFTSLVWLSLGGLLHTFGFGLWTIPLATWFVPLFMLRFSRRVKPLTGALGIWLAFYIGTCIANSGYMPVMPNGLYFIVMGLFSAFYVLPYLADRLIASRFSGFVATLVFPAAWVTMELISSHVNPYGTWTAIAYTQYGNLPLMQLASVTGLAGIAFLISWFGSVGNWIWDAGFNWVSIKRGVLIYAGLWSLVMLGGGARLAFASSDGSAIRVATIRTIPNDEEIRQPLSQISWNASLSAEDREKITPVLEQLQNWFLESARREARAGAKIIAWPETGAPMLDEDEAVFLQRAGEVARQEQVYLLMGMDILHPGEWPLGENKTILVTPSGEVAFTYFKTHLVPGVDTSVYLPGDGSIPTADTPHGRMASVICYDMDFPDHIRQVGRAEVDVLFAPSSDGVLAIGRTHSLMAEFRAIENGVSLVRPARAGVHSAVDPYGRALANMDEFTPEQLVMVAQVPVGRVDTIYAHIGDLFAWLCVAGLLGAIVWTKLRSHQLKYLSIWTGILLKRDRWKMSKKTVSKLPIHQ